MSHRQRSRQWGANIDIVDRIFHFLLMVCLIMHTSIQWYVQFLNSYEYASWIKRLFERVRVRPAHVLESCHHGISLHVYIHLKYVYIIGTEKITVWFSQFPYFICIHVQSSNRICMFTVRN